jgi:hypothetical protein
MLRPAVGSKWVDCWRVSALMSCWDLLTGMALMKTPANGRENHEYQCRWLENGGKGPEIDSMPCKHKGVYGAVENVSQIPIAIEASTIPTAKDAQNPQPSWLEKISGTKKGSPNRTRMTVSLASFEIAGRS